MLTRCWHIGFFFFTLLTGGTGTIVPTYFSGLKRMQKHFNMIFFEVWESIWGEYEVWRVLGSVLGCGIGEGRCGERCGEVLGEVWKRVLGCGGGKGRCGEGKGRDVGKCVGVWRR